MDRAVFYSPFMFIAMWFVTMFALSEICGWSTLAREYRAKHKFAGPLRGWRWGQVNWCSYKGCLWIGASSQGVYVKTGPWIFFRAFHPPLLIPWSAVQSIEDCKYWWIRVFEFKFRDNYVKLRLEATVIEQEVRRYASDKLKTTDRTIWF